jgi:putative Mg2+ transporter-C (MgtC) family protein
MEELIAELRPVPRLLLAVGLAGAIGWERERRARPAGFRTHMALGLAAALFVVLGHEMVAIYAGEPSIRLDTNRILEAIVAAVGFLGAGSIFVSGSDRVMGLTTAASLLVTAAIAACCGLGLYALAVATTIILLTVLRVLAYFERWGAGGSGGESD